MNDQPFEIRRDPARSMLHATLRGFWDEATAARYVAALAEAIAALGRASAIRCWLIDISNFAVQSGEVTDTIGNALSQIVTERDVIALVAPTALGAMQAQRAAPTRAHRRFVKVAEAEAWLAEMRLSG